MPSKQGPKVDAFYHSPLWNRTRKAFIQSKLGICEICGKRGFLVHHRIPLTEGNVDDQSIATDFSNLELLCIDCHNAVHADMNSGNEPKPFITVFGKDGKVSVIGKEQAYGKGNR